MPLGLISDDDFLSELNNSALSPVPSRPIIEPTRPVIEGTIVDAPKLGRVGPEIPEVLRKILGETSEIEGRAEALELAKNFNISPSSVSAYANGATSTATYDKPDEPLQAHIDSSKLKVSKRASHKLMRALAHITDEKLSNAGVSILATVAKSLSGVVRDMEPENRNPIGIGGGNQIILYAPRVIAEGALESVRVED